MEWISQSETSTNYHLSQGVQGAHLWLHLVNEIHSSFPFPINNCPLFFLLPFPYISPNSFMIFQPSRIVNFPNFCLIVPRPDEHSFLPIELEMRYQMGGNKAWEKSCLCSISLCTAQRSIRIWTIRNSRKISIHIHYPSSNSFGLSSTVIPPIRHFYSIETSASKSDYSHMKARRFELIGSSSCLLFRILPFVNWSGKKYAEPHAIKTENDCLFCAKRREVACENTGISASIVWSKR